MNGEIYRGIQVHEQRNIQKTQVDGQRIIQRNTGILIEEYKYRETQVDGQRNREIYRETQLDEEWNI